MLYAYDSGEPLVSQTDALGNVWDYDYDEAGRLDTRTDPKTQATSYAYNLRNQLTGIDYPVGTTDVTFDYDDVGNRTEMVDATGTTTYDYDALDRLMTVTFPGSRIVGYTYDTVGNRASITYPGGSDSVDYEYDQAGNLVSVTDWNSNETTYDYDDAGLLEHANLPNGVVGTYSYDDADRLTSIHWVKGANTLAFGDYTLDDAGNRTQRVDSLGTHTYAYDDLYRLTSVTYPGSDDVDYTYDAVGNRLTLVDSNGTSDYAYDAADRLTSVDPPSASPVTYTWDDNGNLTARGSDSFAWDAEDRMTSATVSSVTTTFAYNGDGLRDSLTVNSNTTSFAWDVNTSLPQLLDDENFRYVYGIGRLSQIGVSTNYYLTDGLGSTMALTDDTGTVVNTYDYDVFGAERASTGTQGNDFTYAGEQRDESTGLQYLRARYYDSEMGRFIGRDPVSGQLGSPATQNPFTYVANQPLNLVDPSGAAAENYAFACSGIGHAEGMTWVQGGDYGLDNPIERFSVDVEISIVSDGCSAVVQARVGTDFPNLLAPSVTLSAGNGSVVRSGILPVETVAVLPGGVSPSNVGVFGYNVQRHALPEKFRVSLSPTLEALDPGRRINIGGYRAPTSLGRVLGYLKNAAGIDPGWNYFDVDLECAFTQ